MLLLALVLINQSANEAPSPYPPDPPCTEYSTYGMSQCLQKQAVVWDRRLNDEYAGALKRVSPQARPALRRAQRLWVKYRDANCEMYSRHEGTVAQLWSAGCPLEMSKERALELRKMD
jgi:uncharacterized protein YecT (DUF1311 family)